MSRPNAPDPYSGFKNDSERRRSLGTRDRWRYLAAMVGFACMGGETALRYAETAFGWLVRLVVA